MENDMDDEILEQMRAEVITRDDLGEQSTSQAVEKSKRVTSRYMTKYERARILGKYAIKYIIESFLLIT